MKRLKGNERGSITVEASIIVPVIILSIITVIYLGFILYQRALLQSVADRAVQNGAASWENLSSDIATGKTGMDRLPDEGLYWRLFEYKKQNKLAEIKKYARDLLAGFNFLSPGSSDVTVEIKDYVVYKRLKVTVENSYLLPLAGVVRLFGSDGRLGIRAVSYAVVDDPAEFIRNTDLIINIEGELENKYPGVKNLGDKAREVFVKIKENIDEFME